MTTKNSAKNLLEKEIGPATFGSFLRAARTAMDATQVEMGKILGVFFHTLLWSKAYLKNDNVYVVNSNTRNNFRNFDSQNKTRSRNTLNTRKDTTKKNSFSR